MANLKNSGIVSVVKADSQREEDPVLSLLAQVPKFEPILGLPIGQNSLFGGKKGVLPYPLREESLNSLLNRCKTHIKQCCDVVVADQQFIASSVTKLDTYCISLANTLATRLNQAKLFEEQINAAAGLEKIVQTTNQSMNSVKDTIKNVEALIQDIQNNKELQANWEKRRSKGWRGLNLQVNFSQLQIGSADQAFVSISSSQGKKRFPRLFKLISADGDIGKQPRFECLAWERLNRHLLQVVDCFGIQTVLIRGLLLPMFLEFRKRRFRLTDTQKFRHRKRLRAVDEVINLLRISGVNFKALVCMKNTFCEQI
ncbi:hypothetical protein HK096_007508 [Nowakowskiella sp. JEL0078]|nr:hypothetical protein HK096_007508 [Nowakowskiella sp. JEL0078]